MSVPIDYARRIHRASDLLAEILGVKYADIEYGPDSGDIYSVRLLFNQPHAKAVQAAAHRTISTVEPAELARELAQQLKPQVELWHARQLAETLE